MKTAIACACLILPLIAQDSLFDPAPKILQIYRERVKPGRESQYRKIETEATRMEARLDFRHAYLTVMSLGKPMDVWFLNGYDSQAAVEQLGREIARQPQLASELSRIPASKAALVSNPHTVFAHYRADLSYGRRSGPQRVRYFAICTISLRSSRAQGYAETAKIIRKGRLRFVYEVDSGMPEGTFVALAPARSIEEARADAVDDAKLRKLSGGAIVKTEINIFRVSPSMSFPAKGWRRADPAFWPPKPRLK
jgi:hypothetical protein